MARTTKTMWEPATGTSQKTRRKSYTEMEKAQRHGDLPKSHEGKCAICGKRAKLVADHPGDNYGDPLKVRFICRSCNSRKRAGKV